jgi:hypothetical protein
MLIPLIRMPPSAIIAGCTIDPPSHVCSHSGLPSDGDTLTAPGALSTRTCSTPSIVTSCGEL